MAAKHWLSYRFCNMLDTQQNNLSGETQGTKTDFKMKQMKGQKSYQGFGLRLCSCLELQSTYIFERWNDN